MDDHFSLGGSLLGCNGKHHVLLVTGCSGWCYLIQTYLKLLLSVQALFSLPFMRFSSRCSDFLPQAKHFRLICDCKLAVGVKVSMCDCLDLCVRPGKYHVSSHSKWSGTGSRWTHSERERQSKQYPGKGREEERDRERERRKQPRGSRDRNLEYGSLNSTINLNFNMFIIN